MAQRFDSQRLVLAGEPVTVARGVASYGGGSSPPFSAFSASDNGLLVWKMQAGDSLGTEMTWFDRSGRRLGTVAGQSEYSGPALSADESRLVVARRDGDARYRYEIVNRPSDATGERPVGNALAIAAGCR